MRALRSAVVLIALATGCTDSCACGEGGEDSAATHGSAPGSAGGAATSKPGANAANAGVSGAGAVPTAQPNWQPAPDSPLTRQLAAAKAELETEQVYDKLAAETALAHPLGDRLGELKADGALSSTTRSGSESKLAVSARNYKQGDKTVRVKITDTGQLPNARQVVAGRLTLIGNEAVGNEHGVFVRGYPAVIAHYPEHKVSRASALLAGRYLVQVMVRNAGDPEEALRVIERLDFGQLAPKQGKIPAAQ